MKRFTSAIIVLAMLAAMMITMIPTASAAWDGSSVSAALVGSGTEYDPYLVTSENDLAFVAKQVNDGATAYAGEYFKLTTDLDLGGQNWTPIGVAKPNFFSGIFDGDGHTVYGLKVFTNPEDSNALYGGVFGRVDNGTVKNLTVEGANVVSYKYSGAVVGNLTAKATGEPAAVINCHAVNCEIRGLQIGGIVGRASQKSVNKGFLKITGCSANSITLKTILPEDFPNLSVDNANHFVGGIVGGAGATVVSGCTATQITVEAHGTGFAPIGGIVGVLGADGVTGDVVNCSVVGVNITASAESHPEKTSIGGLIGKSGHVSASAGDPNTESDVFNCFVADVKINNQTSSVNNGVVIGLVNDTMRFNDVYYVPETGLEAYGTDVYESDYPFAPVNSLADLSVEKLNKGNSTAVWVTNLAVGYPTIDVDAAIANQPTFVDYSVENAGNTEETTEAPKTDDTTKAPEETTKAPEETTKAPEQTTEAPEADDTSKAPEQTNAPAQTDKAEEKGCGGMIAGGVMVIALLGTAIVFKSNKN